MSPRGDHLLETTEQTVSVDEVEFVGGSRNNELRPTCFPAFAAQTYRRYYRRTCIQT